VPDVPVPDVPVPDFAVLSVVVTAGSFPVTQSEKVRS